MVETGYLLCFLNHIVYFFFVLDSLIEHEVLVKFAFVIYRRGYRGGARGVVMFEKTGLI